MGLLLHGSNLPSSREVCRVHWLRSESGLTANYFVHECVRLHTRQSLTFFNLFSALCEKAEHVSRSSQPCKKKAKHLSRSPRRCENNRVSCSNESQIFFVLFATEFCSARTVETVLDIKSEFSCLSNFLEVLQENESSMKIDVAIPSWADELCWQQKLFSKFSRAVFK